MIYIDTSVALAHLFGKDRHPPDSLWDQTLVSSKLTEYELWTRIHAYGVADTHGDDARALIGRLALVRMEPAVLSRALEVFPGPVRTLDALHLSTLHFLREQGQAVRLASYDQRMIDVAGALGWPVADCG